MKIKTAFTYIETEEYKNWFKFYPKKDNNGFRFTVEKYGYFDPRPQITTNVTSLIAIILPFLSLYLLPFTVLFLFKGWGQMFINLPIDTGKNDECESPTYGIMFYDTSGKFPEEMWIRKGSRMEVIEFPWHYKWSSRELLLKDGNYEKETPKNKKYFYKDEWKEKAFSEEYDYHYTLSNGSSQKTKATVGVQKMSWVNWWGLNKKTRTSIQVEFKDEIGEKAGSWKGGVIGCSYDLLDNETPRQALSRMEKERRFN